MRKNLWKRGLTFVLLGTFLLNLAGCANGVEEGGENVTQVMAICTAQYPKMNPYPETDGFDYDEAAYAAWRASRNEREPESTEYQKGIREFYETTVQEFLGGTTGENKVYSPLNLYMALAMLAETTDGTSREQILNLLHVDSIEKLRNNANVLWNANYCDDGTVTSILAASVWLKENFQYNTDTLNTLAENYYASAFQGTMGADAYNKELQKWLNEQTGGLLEEQAAQVEMDPMTVLALATTVYYRAKWANEFQPANTTEDVFYTAQGEVTTEFMHQSRSDSYYWGDNFSAISRSLENSGEMLFLLPDEGVTPEELLTDTQALDFIYDHRSWENEKYLIVNQSIPKFDVVSDMELVTGLKNLGVTDVFDFEASDFTPLTSETELALSQAKHAARVKIDEEGCVAAAFTVMIACGSGMPPKDEVDFILNRPFVFVLNGQDGQPLFIGVVNQP